MTDDVMQMLFSSRLCEVLSHRGKLLKGGDGVERLLTLPDNTDLLGSVELVL